MSPVHGRGPALKPSRLPPRICLRKNVAQARRHRQESNPGVVMRDSSLSLSLSFPSSLLSILPHSCSPSLSHIYLSLWKVNGKEGEKRELDSLLEMTATACSGPQ